ncbi:MAG: hypothetical protein MJ179_02705 [Treponema sp.]|nr:hypothetical protein [Treponema sp.]
MNEETKILMDMVERILQFVKGGEQAIELIAEDKKAECYKQFVIGIKNMLEFSIDRTNEEIENTINKMAEALGGEND